MPLLTIDQLAEELQVSERTISRMVKAGLPCIRIGRAIRFRKESIDRYLDRLEEDRVRLVQRRPKVFRHYKKGQD